MTESLLSGLASLEALTLQSQQLRANPLADATTAPAGSAEQAAEDFESFFLSQMLGHMFQGVGNDPLFGGGPGEQVFRSMMVQEYATVIAKNGGIGLSDNVTREILRLQEAGQ